MVNLSHKLLSEWHHSLNKGLDPSKIHAGSYKKAWWICPKGKDHVWKATIASRSKGAGCPFCSGRIASSTNNLALSNPELAAEWHPTKNGNLTPNNVTFGSDKVVWWKCPKGKDHEWDTRVQHRSKGEGCPICSGKRVIQSNSLSYLNPELASEWHPTKNGDLAPNKVTINSEKRVWWKCSKGDDHVWDATIVCRTKGGKCPYCSGLKASKTNNLVITNPTLARQWHPSMNGDLTPEKFTSRSSKKIWWKCSKGDDHEWKAAINYRAGGIGCPACRKRKLVKSNSLGTVNPELASEWHPTKNGTLTPFDVFPSQYKKVWWKCKINPKHEWQTTINNRANSKGCPYCSNKKINRENSLGTVNPKLAEQWHPIKNGDLTPFDVAPSAKAKVWWKCPRGDDHEWEATINKRATGTGCPKCAPFWSEPELRLYCELECIFPSLVHREYINEFEVDLYIPELKIGIEYDGLYWHKNKVEKDKKKNDALKSSIRLFRIREKGLPRLDESDIILEDNLSISSLKDLLRDIISMMELSEDYLSSIKSYLLNEKWIAERKFKRLLSEKKVINYKKSLEYLYPELAKEWHPTKNGELLPSQLSYGTRQKVWWLGKCSHEWEDSLNHRTRGRDCPKCRYKKASRTRMKKREAGQLKLF